jgi:hypothetical protein
VPEAGAGDRLAADPRELLVGLAQAGLMAADDLPPIREQIIGAYLVELGMTC